MSCAWHKESVRRITEKKPWLKPVFSDVYNISGRLREYDKALFVVWNEENKKYEIHSLNHIGDTFAADVPNNALDARVLAVVRQGDLRVHGKRVFAEIDAHNQRVKERKRREQRNLSEAAARDLQSALRPLAWG